MARFFQLAPARTGARHIVFIAPVKHENRALEPVNRVAFRAIDEKQYIGTVRRFIFIGQPYRLAVSMLGKPRVAFGGMR